MSSLAVLSEGLMMDEFDERTKANMDVVLDAICTELPHGGDHESRKFIAEQLMQAARGGKTTWRVDLCQPAGTDPASEQAQVCLIATSA